MHAAAAPLPAPPRLRCRDGDAHARCGADRGLPDARGGQGPSPCVHRPPPLIGSDRRRWQRRRAPCACRSAGRTKPGSGFATSYNVQAADSSECASVQGGVTCSLSSSCTALLSSAHLVRDSVVGQRAAVTHCPSLSSPSPPVKERGAFLTRRRRGAGSGDRAANERTTRGSAGEGHLRHGREHLRFSSRGQRLGSLEGVCTARG